MSSPTRTGTGSHAASDGVRDSVRDHAPARRLTTETKHATKTTEFFAYLAVLAGILIAGLMIEDNGGQNFFAADKVWLYATLLTIGYMISRGLAKSGSRDPYWDRDDRGGRNGH
jgi:hypothetical protein